MAWNDCQTPMFSLQPNCTKSLPRLPSRTHIIKVRVGVNLHHNEATYGSLTTKHGPSCRWCGPTQDYRIILQYEVVWCCRSTVDRPSASFGKENGYISLCSICASNYLSFADSRQYRWTKVTSWEDVLVCISLSRIRVSCWRTRFLTCFLVSSCEVYKPISNLNWCSGI